MTQNENAEFVAEAGPPHLPGTRSLREACVSTNLFRPPGTVQFDSAKIVRLGSSVSMAAPVIHGADDGGALSGHGEDDGRRVREQGLGKISGGGKRSQCRCSSISHNLYHLRLFYKYYYKSVTNTMPVWYVGQLHVYASKCNIFLMKVDQ